MLTAVSRYHQIPLLLSGLMLGGWAWAAQPPALSDLAAPPIASLNPLPDADGPLREERLAALPAAEQLAAGNSWRALSANDLVIARQALAPLLAQPQPHAEALLLLAEIALHSRDWTRAALLLSAAVSASSDERLIIAARERLALLQANWADDPQWQPQPVSTGLRLPLRFLYHNNVVPRSSRYLNVASHPQLRWHSLGNPRFAVLSAPDLLVVYDRDSRRLLSLPLPGEPVQLALTTTTAYAWRSDSPLLWRWQLPDWQPLAPTTLSRPAGHDWRVITGASAAEPVAEGALLVLRNANDLQLINASGGEPLVIEAPQSGPQVAVAVAPHGHSALLYLPQQQRLELWDLASGQRRAATAVDLPAGQAARFAAISWQLGQGLLQPVDGGPQLLFSLTGEGLITSQQLPPSVAEQQSSRHDLLLAGDAQQVSILGTSHRLPAAAVTLAHGDYLVQYQPQQLQLTLYGLDGQRQGELNLDLPALVAQPQLQVAPLGRDQLLLTISGYPPAVLQLPQGQLTRVLVAETDQPLVSSHALADGTVLTIHDSGGEGDAELFVWEADPQPAALKTLLEALPPRSDEAATAYVERLAQLSTPYCSRVYPLNYEPQTGLYSVEWQGAEVAIVVPAHSRAPRARYLRLCGTLHAITSELLELRDISLESR